MKLNWHTRVYILFDFLRYIIRAEHWLARDTLIYIIQNLNRSDHNYVMLKELLNHFSFETNCSKEPTLSVLHLNASEKRKPLLSNNNSSDRNSLVATFNVRIRVKIL